MTKKILKNSKAATILVVDDNIQNLKLLEGMLGGAGYRVRPALDGATALRAASVSPPDLVLLDINMPGMNGFEVCRSLKKDAGLCDIPVIFISALTETAEKIEAFDCGGVDYVTKPFHFKEVQARLETHLALHDLRQRLELRVQQRTSELEDANRKLHHEIAERKKTAEEKLALERRLHQTEKMETLGNMVGGISHDFGNLLVPIVGYTELLQMTLAKDDCASLQFLDQILKSSQRGQKMIKQLLAFSREETPEKEMLDLSTLLGEAICQLRVTLPNQVSMVQLIDVPGCIVMADATQFHQVIMNLGINACHSMADAGGTLTIELDKISVETGEQCRQYSVGKGNYVRLEVRDTGVGIAKENLDQIFKPFFTTRKNGKGTGFGLSMALNTVKSLNGTITVKSTPGKGSCFTVLLPEIENREVGIQLLTGEKENKKNGKIGILVVDNDRAISLLFSEMLKNAGYFPTTCASSAKSLELFSRQPECFDLILMDMHMPDMDGLELSRRLTTLGCAIPIIIISGDHQTLEQQQLVELGIHSQLHKPVSIAMLLTAVKEALGQD